MTTLAKKRLMLPSMKKLKTWFNLLWINTKFELYSFFEFLRTIKNFYPRWAFMRADLYLLSSYFCHSPYTISKKYLMKKGSDNPYAYGETPLTTLQQVVKTCGITKIDRVIELGCGRGRTCFWLNQYLGCDVVGIDFIPEFIGKAKAVEQELGLVGIEFRCEDYLDSDLSGATVIYLFGTTLSDDEVAELAEKLSQLPMGTKVITVSYPLTDYPKGDAFELMKIFEGSFPWGEGEIYLQIRK